MFDTAGFRFFCPGRSLLTCVFAVAVVAGLVRPAAAAPAFPLHTSGRFIVDSNGTRVRLSAFNWYGAESTDFVVEGLEAQPLASIVATIKGMGFNTVRLPFSNQLVETNPVVGNYALAANAGMEGEHALMILDQVVQALTNAGIMVILDDHMSDAGWCCSTKDNNELWYNTNYPEANWIADWQAMAQRYQSNAMVIGVDLRNEPRGTATWGGSASTDWHAAAQRGGNAVLAVNPGLLVFVEGVNYAGDLKGVASLPVQLNVADHVVYEAHDYGFWYSGGFTSYSNYVNTITPKWGYLVTGANPQPLWVGEFGTCHSADTCVKSSSKSDLGYWFNAVTSYVQQYGLDWSYWAINGTTESGTSGGFGAVEGYGVLNAAWNASALPSLTTRLQSMMAAAPGISLVPSVLGISVPAGAQANGTVTIVPGGGFSGMVNLSCAVSGPASGVAAPQCSVPAMENVTGNAAVNVTASVTTSASASNEAPRLWMGRLGGAALCGLLIFCGELCRARKSLLMLLMVVCSGFALLGCGGSGTGGSSSAATTAGGYMVTVTASGSGISTVSAQFGFTVQ